MLKLNIDNNPFFPFVAALLVGFLIWLILVFTPGIQGYVAFILGFIFAGITLYVLLFATKTLPKEWAAMLFGAIFSGPITFAFFGIITSGNVVVAFPIAVFGAVAGGLFAGLAYKFFSAKEELDTEALKAEEYVERGKTASKYEDYSETVKFFKMALYTNKDKAPDRTAFLMAQIYENKIHNHKEATYWYRRTIGYANSLGIDPENIFAKEAAQGISRLKELHERKDIKMVDGLSRVKAHIEAEEFDQAKKTLEDLEKLHPDNAEVDYLHGHFHFRRHIYGMAVEYFNRALKNDPGHVLAAYFKGFALEQSKQLHEAQDAFIAYIDLASGDPIEAKRVEQVKQKLEKIRKQIKFAPIVD